MSETTQNLPVAGFYAITVDKSNRGVNSQEYVGGLEITGTGPNLFVHLTEEWNGRRRFHVNAALDMSQGTGLTLIQDEGRPFTYKIKKLHGARGDFWTFEHVGWRSKSHQIFMNPKLETRRGPQLGLVRAHVNHGWSAAQHKLRFAFLY